MQTENAQREDREKQRDRVYRDRIDRRNSLTARSDDQFRHRRDTYIEFYGASFDVVFHAMPGETLNLPRDPDQTNLRFERMSRAYSTLMIIEQALIGESASNLWDATIQIAGAQLAGRSTEEMVNERTTLQKARLEFSAAANELLKGHLAEIEAEITKLGDPLQV